MFNRSPLLLPGVLCACSALITSPVIADPPQVQVKDLGTLGGRFTVANDMNDAGDVTGYSESSDGQIHAFLYSQGELHDLGTLGGSGSLGNAINQAGQVTGFALTATGEAHAFLYAAGTMTDLGPSGATSQGKAINLKGQVAGETTPAGASANAVLYSAGAVNVFGKVGSSSTSEAITDAGQVAGTYQDSSGSHAFLYSGGSSIDLMPGYTSFVSGTRAININGAVAGYFQANDTFHGFVYVNGNPTDIGSLGGDYTIATAINSAGKVTGISATAAGPRHAFIYSAGNATDLGTLGGSFSVGYALSDADQVAGQSMTAAGELHAFVSQQDGSLLDLGELVAALASPGAVVDSVAIGINRSGQVVGHYTLSVPSDTQMPAQTRSFVAITSVSATTLFQNLLTLVAGVGPGKSLENKLQQALLSYLANDIPASCSALNGLLHEVAAQDGKKIDPQTALQVTQQTQGLENAIGCSP